MEGSLQGGATRPLDGIRVLDLAHMLAGPLATMMLADLGAEVIKVEAPDGDPTRSIGGQGIMYLCANRNKRSVSVDLRSEAGRDVVLRLAATSDVVVEAFRPGVMEKLGLGLDDLRAVNPNIIKASLVGFGSTGPDSDRRGMDLVLQAEAGIMSITGEADGPPLKVGFQLVDCATGLSLSQAILAALLRRERFGEPSEIEARLLDTALFLQTYQLTEMSIRKVPPPRTGNSAPHAAPSDLVHTKDGDLVLAAYFEDQWRGLCEVLDLEWMLEDPRFSTLPARLANRAEMLRLLEERLVTGSRSYWYARLNARGVLVGEVRTYDEILASEQAQVNGVFLTCELADGTPVTVVNTPYAASWDPVDTTAPPELGAASREVATALGYAPAEVEALVADGVLHVPDPARPSKYF